jgi:Fis family transcriptional regulator
VLRERCLIGESTTVVTTTQHKSATRKKKKSKSKTAKTKQAKARKSLSDMTEQALKDYFKTLNGHSTNDLYDLVIREVELPLFRCVMDYTDGNQSRAAEILGINRSTLRKKLKTYSLID